MNCIGNSNRPLRAVYILLRRFYELLSVVALSLFIEKMKNDQIKGVKTSLSNSALVSEAVLRRLFNGFAEQCPWVVAVPMIERGGIGSIGGIGGRCVPQKVGVCSSHRFRVPRFGVGFYVRPKCPGR